MAADGSIHPSRSVRFASTNDLHSPNSPPSSALFSYDVSDESADEGDALSGTGNRKGEASASGKRFQSSGGGGGVTTLGLKSTTSSKEAQYDADSDELGDEDLDALSVSAATLNQNPSSRGDRIPLPAALSRHSTDGITEGLVEIRNQLRDIELPDWLRRGAGVFEATVNMANSILGAGVVGLPYSLRTSGFVAGLGLLAGLALLTDWTIRLIVLNAKLSGRTTYIDIMQHCFGNHGRAAVSLFQFAFAFGGMCAFCVVIGDTIPSVLKQLLPFLADSFLTGRMFIITICTLGISYPLSLYRDIESLSRASAVALFSMVLIIVAVIVRGPAMPPELKGDPAQRFTIIAPSGIVRSIAVISFAFVCHHNSLLIYGSLKEPSMDKFQRVTHYSTAIAASAAIAMSIAGYWSFTDKTLSNVLNNFPHEDTMVNVARFLFGVNMFTTLPLEAFVAREVLETYFFAGEFDQTRHIIFTSALVVSAMIVSLSTCDLGIVLELTGGLSATTLAFIFPSICFLKLANDSSSSARVDRVVPELTSESNTTSRGRTSRRSGGDGENEESEDEDAQLSDLEGEAGMNEADLTVDEMELPLRPGARARQRPPGSQKRPWWASTKPLAVVTALFGLAVLVISVLQALGDAAEGRAGAVHQC
ncbi:amino acid transporter [Ceraceosorus bombacis]|uniref:Amino acid transporter n=1 Tax=Ceraceosorus bombacis TaxID=401625 RepID=A0A0P1BQQ3_9BASI|nr:amino acid transporter [Ceraceosorus bombacis]